MRRWALGLGAAWAVLLIASTLLRQAHPAPGALSPGERIVTVGSVSGDRLGPRPVRIAVFDSAPPDRPGAPVIVLLHGSPGDNGEVLRMARVLGRQYRVIAPDLPGFGGSDRTVPDYSIRAHGRYVAQLLDSLGIRRAHVLGFSMGGGVALSLADIAPAKVASLILLSAIGVQEFELTGDYSLNHLIHGLQLGGLWLLYNAVPHFGALDGGDLSVEYARNFYDTDQRPLRGIMSRYAGPMLIIQGRHDPLVPPAIGPEHARIVPQSELLLLEGDHFMAFQRPEELAGPIGSFIARVEAGTAATRARATPERLAAAARPFDPMARPPAAGLALVILLLLLAAATLVSEDLTCIAAGLLVSRGTLPFLPATVACLVGIVGGDLLLYGLGRSLGRAMVSRAPLRWLLRESDVARTSAWFTRRGPALVLTSRFVPGTRLPTYVAAGVLHTPFVPFALFFLLAAALWTPLLVGVAMLYGDMGLMAFAAWRTWSLPALLASGLLLLLAVKLVIPLFSWRGRRLLLSRWRRLVRWEFWPPWAFYPPVVLYVLWLAIRHRSLTLFTAANPGIEGGGFAGESKWEILRGLAGPAGPGGEGEGGSLSGPHTGDGIFPGDAVLPATAFIPGAAPLAERIRRVESFAERCRLAWPIILKPDIGERGRGVRVVRSAAEAGAYLAATGGDVLAQEFVEGREFGVFYCRMPGEERATIFSITDKRLPTVTGDGAATLETLILGDDRAVCIAPMLLARHAARLEEVPTAGQVVPLVELGTHSRGAAFYDGTALATPALLAAVDAISRRFDGFRFGRYDVRAESVEAFQAGRFRVIELNGATSEATSIYDPAHSLAAAYRTLATQWRILFEIGARNRQAGVRPAGVGQLMALLRRHRAARQGSST